MIPMIDIELQRVIRYYEKEIKNLNNYINLLLEEKHMAQTAYFVAGLTAGFILSVIFIMWVVK